MVRGARYLGDQYGTDVRPDISKHIPFIHLGPENGNPFIYLSLKITTYKITSVVRRE